MADKVPPPTGTAKMDPFVQDQPQRPRFRDDRDDRRRSDDRYHDDRRDNRRDDDRRYDDRDDYDNRDRRSRGGGGGGGYSRGGEDRGYYDDRRSHGGGGGGYGPNYGSGQVMPYPPSPQYSAPSAQQSSAQMMVYAPQITQTPVASPQQSGNVTNIIVNNRRRNRNVRTPSALRCKLQCA